MPLGKVFWAKDERRESCSERLLQAQPQGRPENSLRRYWRQQGKPKPFRVLGRTRQSLGGRFERCWTSGAS